LSQSSTNIGLKTMLFRKYSISDLHLFCFMDSRGRVRTVVGFTTTCAIRAYHHYISHSILLYWYSTGTNFLMVWIYLSLVALWRGQCSRQWAVAPHWQNGEFTMFLRNKWWLRELHCIRNLACKICPSRVPI
jgi:hypothetical protein